MTLGIVTLLFVINNVSFSQAFEGKIIYKSSVESANPKSISQTHIDMMFNDLDTIAVLFLRGSQYKFVTIDSKSNSPESITQYDSVSNRLYSYIASDSIPYVFTTENDLMVPFRITEDKNDKIIILGKKCSSITIDYGTSNAKIYFSDEYKVNTKSVRKDAPGFLQYINECGALPLKIILSGKGLIHNLVFTAKDIKEETLDSNIFRIPNK